MRFLLQAYVLLVVACFPSATPSLLLLPATESEAPVEQEASPEEAALAEQTRTRVARDQLSRRLPVPLRVIRANGPSRLTILPPSGHRISNHLLAPLRC